MSFEFKHFKFVIILFLIPIIFSLSSCKKQDYKKDVDHYISSIKNQTNMSIEPLPQFLQSFEKSLKNKMLNKTIEYNDDQCQLQNDETKSLMLTGFLSNAFQHWAIIRDVHQHYFKMNDKSLVGKDCKPLNQLTRLVEFNRGLTHNQNNTNFISMNVYKVPIKQLFFWLGEMKNENVVVNQTINNDLTLKLNNISYDEALNTLLSSSQLCKKTLGHVVFIDPCENDFDKTSVNTDKLSSLIVHLKYANAQHILDLVKDKNQGLLSKNGSVTIDPRTNMILFFDEANRLQSIKKYIEKLDAPVPQVLIKARIVNIDNDYERELGIRYHFKPKEVVKDQGQKSLNEDLPNSLRTSSDLGIALYKLAKGTLLDLELSALENEGKAEIVSSPSLLTANQQTAHIEAGEEIPYQESAGRGGSSTSFKKAVLSLKVTPQIIPGRRVILHLEVNQDKRSSQEVRGVPAIDTRHVTTQVLVNDNQTVVLGGIYELTKTHHIERVPFISNIPLIGVLFQYQKRVNNRRELLIFVTPTIINDNKL